MTPLSSQAITPSSNASSTTAAESVFTPPEPPTARRNGTRNPPLAAVDVVHYIPGMASPQFPEPPASIPATPLDEVDRRVARVAAKKDEWPKVTIPQRIHYLRRCLEGVMAASQRWVEDGCKLKGIQPGDVLEGEEWLAGPMTTARNIRLLIQALESGGQPTPPAVRKRGDGQVVATVFPSNMQDKLMFGGFTAEVWIEP